METIQSMPSESRNGDFESSQGNHSQKRIYKTIYDV